MVLLIDWLILIVFLHLRQRTRYPLVQSFSGFQKYLELAILGAMHFFTFIPIKNEPSLKSDGRASFQYIVSICFGVILVSKLIPFSIFRFGCLSAYPASQLDGVLECYPMITRYLGSTYFV
jgi:hypothetical protein